MQAKRTLVKSPPELWAELSDPTALARHLGELGEIRIVSTEPERSVEWEAAQISGSVLIEPSGWGTKVTLTATRRDLAGSEAQADPPEIASEPASISQPTLIPEQVPDITQTLEPDAVEVAQPELPEPTPDLQPEPVEITGPGDPTPVAEVETIEIVAGVETIEIVAEPEHAAAPQGELEALNVIEPGAEPMQELQPDAIEIAPEPRLGFFARLFRRRKSRRADEPPRELEALVQAASPAVEQASPEEPTDEQPNLATPDAPSPNVEFAVEPAEPGREAPSEGTGAPAVCAEPTGQVPIGATDLPDASTEPDVEASTDMAEPAEPPDISAELAEVEQLADAEETDTEDVTAVLTSVLDRLGAAHHRPFSRA